MGIVTQGKEAESEPWNLVEAGRKRKYLLQKEGHGLGAYLAGT